MRKTGIALFLILACAAVLAQTSNPNPPGPPDPATRAQRRVQHLATVLNLTAAQQQQTTTIFTGAATAGSTTHSSMQAARQALETAVNNNDSAAIEQAANTIGSLTAQMVANEAKANAAFFQILTPDQQNKMRQVETERPRGWGRGMGPGMAGRPPR